MKNTDKIFYSVTGKWWGQAEGKITADDYERAEIIRRLAGLPPKRILELGSAYGNTAAVCAEAGYDITGVEYSERIEFAREYEVKKYRGALHFVKQDFYKYRTEKLFDLVTYWNGFGLGTDEDLRKLLTKMASEWLTPDGCALIDIQNPFVWERWSGEHENKLANPEDGYPENVSEVITFDQVENRFTDTWWVTEKPEEKVFQVMRCFAPADFRLLVEGTGLRIDKMEIAKKPEHQYLVKLCRA